MFFGDNMNRIIAIEHAINEGMNPSEKMLSFYMRYASEIEDDFNNSSEYFDDSDDTDFSVDSAKKYSKERLPVLSVGEKKAISDLFTSVMERRSF